ncbi:MAG TPA: spore maturation protein A [Clostridiales bacterium]|nr:spore maturation protein A [Clostridiales bacterium]
MLMGWIWTGMVGISILCAVLNGEGSELAAAVFQGAGSGVTLVISMAGAVCLWSGAAAVMESAGIMGMLSRLFRPLLHRVFPSTRRDTRLAGFLSGNFCANLLGLGNAATPLGIQAARQLAGGQTAANDELCRLVVLNTASIQLIPANVAALRAALGCQSPFDILPAVWVTSLLSAGLGVACAWVLGKVWKP